MLESSFELGGRVCVVTGGAGILGEPMCAALVRHGARVAIIDQNPQKNEEVCDRIRAENSSTCIMAVTADIRSRPQVENAAATIERTMGAPIDVLVNNAAAKSPNFFTPFEDFPLDDWNQVMNINLTASMICCQVIGGAMASRGRGSVINLISIYGIVAPDQRIYEGAQYEGKAINTPAVYSASKAGLWGLTKFLASYWGAKGVRVNAVTPGGIFSGQNDVFVNRYSARVPLGRMGKKEEISGTIVYLASDASSYISGQNLIVDGGLTVW